MNIRQTAVVMPCLNEAGSLQQTCASLGFGIGQDSPKDSVLILVDNGSVDESAAIAQTIIETSPPGTVHFRVEPERGYVPPRRRGNLVANAVATERGLSADNVLILQADADTTYSCGYLDQMRSVAEVEEPSVLLQARTSYPSSFAISNGSYIELCEQVDGEFGGLLLDHPDQVIIDDKAAGYLLSDYFKWGGHQREFRANGDEIHSETARLFIRAKTYGCRIVSVDTALAEHSIRRVTSEPAFDLATAGFPRENAWRTFWDQQSKQVDSIDHLFAPENQLILQKAMALRRKHLLALFGLLPVHVARSLGKVTCLDDRPDIFRITLPDRPAEALRTSPGMFIEDVLKAASLLED